MQFDLCFVLLDLGEPWYKQAASEMIRSARRAYKDHDMRVVQLGDNRSPHCPDADGVFGLDTDVKGNELAYAKGHLMATYALQAEHPVIFCDVGLIWNTDYLASASPYLQHVACLWREDFPCMPFNTGIVVTPPKMGFWQTYLAAIGSLPPEMRAWWGDQVAMMAADSLLGSGATRMPMDKIAPTITDLPDAPLTTPAVHFKGDTKHLMIPYARIVDRGAGFEFARPQTTPTLPASDPMVRAFAEGSREGHMIQPGKVAIDRATEFYRKLRAEPLAVGDPEEKFQAWTF